jgi:hypothetical protein
MRRWTVGQKEKVMPTDMTRFQKSLQRRVPGTTPTGTLVARRRAVQQRLSHTRLTRLFAEQDASEGADRQ